MSQGIELLGLLVSEGDFPHIGEVERVLKMLNRTDVDEDQFEKEMDAMRAQLVMQDPDYSFWNKDLLMAIDDIGMDKFQDARRVMGMVEPGYVNALTDYTKDVIAIIMEKNFEHSLMSKVISRLKFAMNDTKALPVALPLMTDVVIDSLATSFKDTPYAINTVSSCIFVNVYCAY